MSVTQLKFSIFFFDIRLIYHGYPADILDILIYGEQISSTVLPLDSAFEFSSYSVLQLYVEFFECFDLIVASVRIPV